MSPVQVRVSPPQIYKKSPLRKKGDFFYDVSKHEFDSMSEIYFLYSIFAFSSIFCYTFSMTTNISVLLEILSSIRHEWLYADAIITKIESGNLQNEDIGDIAELIKESISGIENKDVQVKMKNILFQISLIHLEEWDLKKQDLREADEVIAHL